MAWWACSGRRRAAARRAASDGAPERGRSPPWSEECCGCRRSPSSSSATRATWPPSSATSVDPTERAVGWRISWGIMGTELGFPGRGWPVTRSMRSACAPARRCRRRPAGRDRVARVPRVAEGRSQRRAPRRAGRRGGRPGRGRRLAGDRAGGPLPGALVVGDRRRRLAVGPLVGLVAAGRRCGSELSSPSRPSPHSSCSSAVMVGRAVSVEVPNAQDSVASSGGSPSDHGRARRGRVVLRGRLDGRPRLGCRGFGRVRGPRPEGTARGRGSPARCRASERGGPPHPRGATDSSSSWRPTSWRGVSPRRPGRRPSPSFDPLSPTERARTEELLGRDRRPARRRQLGLVARRHPARPPGTGRTGRPRGARRRAG